MRKSYFGDSKFDKAYFTGKHPAGYEDGYEKNILEGDYGCYSSFKKAAKFIKDLGVKDYLEIGCACGYLMEELMKYGIRVTGWDVSEYIINRADPSVRPFMELKDIKEIVSLPDKSFDLVHVSTVLGYVPEAELDFYLSEIKRITRKYAVLYAGTPEDAPEENGIRKINKPDEWWNKQFAEYFKEKDISRFLWEAL
ncbi:MAG: class I SAM-dependent methyltransferase [Candidatus Falkowbacteria bacterium]